MRRKRSTKETNRRKAAEIARSFEAASRKFRTAAQTRQVIRDIHQSLTGEQVTELSVRQNCDQWLLEKRDETKVATYQFYSASMERFVVFLKVKADREIALVSRADIMAYRTSLAKSLTKSSVNHHLKCLKMFFKWARKTESVAEDPTEFVETLRDTEKDQQRRPFSLDELRQILVAASLEWKSMILCGLYTGQRLSDVATMQWSDLNLSQGHLTLRTRKTGKHLKLPLAKPLWDHLNDLKKSVPTETQYIHPKAAETVSRTGKTRACFKIANVVKSA